jgi:hypothetical protein
MTLKITFYLSYVAYAIVALSVFSGGFDILWNIIDLG